MNEDRSWLMNHSYFGNGNPPPKPKSAPPPKKKKVEGEKPVTTSIAAASFKANSVQRKLAYKLTGAKIKIICFDSSTVSFSDVDSNEKFEIPLGDWWRELKKISDGLP